jgi:four helix bundle protein
MAQLIALNVARELICALREPVERIEKRDRSLADQLRRAGSSVTLNIREGAERRGKDREHLWRVAAGSAAEVDEALHTALAWGYAPHDLIAPAQTLASRVLALLWRLAPPKR